MNKKINMSVMDFDYFCYMGVKINFTFTKIYLYRYLKKMFITLQILLSNIAFNITYNFHENIAIIFAIT